MNSGRFTTPVDSVMNRYIDSPAMSRAARPPESPLAFSQVFSAANRVYSTGGQAPSIALDDTSERAGPITFTPPTQTGPISIEQRSVALNARRETDVDDARVSAEQLVASALLLPLLEQLDSSSLRPKDGPFAQTLGEKRFGPLLHQHLADRMVTSRSFGLVDSVVRHLRGETVEVRA